MYKKLLFSFVLICRSKINIGPNAPHRELQPGKSYRIGFTYVGADFGAVNHKVAFHFDGRVKIVKDMRIRYIIAILIK